MSRDPVIDLQHLALFTAGDAALEREIFALFREQVSQWMRLLEPAGDLESWRAAAHTLKGTAKGVGASRLAEACAAAERLGDEASTQVARSAAAAEVREAAYEALAFVDRRLGDAAARSGGLG